MNAMAKRLEAVDHEPLVVEDVGAVDWADAADIVVVGYGGAGVCAALQAKELGVDVLAIDRFDGGGATAFSGGVIYAAGTRFQAEAGVEDTADELFKYLKVETRGAVSDDTLRRFCDGSNEDVEWVVKHGVRLGGNLYADKSAYPPDDYTLYWCGNERVERYATVAKPAPRGHRTVGAGYTGRLFYAALRESADRLGIRTSPHSPVKRLVVGPGGEVVGVEVVVLDTEATTEHANLYQQANPQVPFKFAKKQAASQAARELELKSAVTRFIRARAGVILSTGGFAYNQDMVAKYRPEIAKNYSSLVRLASMGCDGTGIQLGQSAGGAVDHMDSVFSATSIAPPLSMLDGIIVNNKGERFINEDAYAGFLGSAITAQPSQQAWLILNRPTAWKVMRDLWPTGDTQWKNFILPQAINLFLGGTKRARTVQGLAKKLGIPSAALQHTIESHDAAAGSGGNDAVGKAKKYQKPLGNGPFTALNFSIDNAYGFPFFFTLGGLRINEQTGAVRREDGTDIPGLYAAGRAAVGLPSLGYISGMSLSDNVFSGRRAATSAVESRNG